MHALNIVTVNGRSYSMLDDSGFQYIINPILYGIRNTLVLNSSSIKWVMSIFYFYNTILSFKYLNFFAQILSGRLYLYIYLLFF